jgi:transketolase
LLGFRRNPTSGTPLFKKFAVKALDGHPIPMTPFVRLSTGASGVGVPASLGLAWGAADLFGEDAPRVHILEGEGGLTPGRVSEALAAGGTASLGNAILHVDWNQASMDSERVCREGETPGDYVQWTPAELAYLNDWNAILVTDGLDWQQIAAAQNLALSLDNGQPTAIVYRTVKGWKYGIEGRASHGAGHPLCSAGFFDAIDPLLPKGVAKVPSCAPGPQRCGGTSPEVIEECFWETLQLIRGALEARRPMIEALAGALAAARTRLDRRGRQRRPEAPEVGAVYKLAATGGPPPAIAHAPGEKVTLREELARVLNHFNRASAGAIVISSADLFGSTSVAKACEGFPKGFYNRRSNPLSRQLPAGGICEDAMTALLSGISSFGGHIGAGSSYGAFSAPLGHIAARLHAIGNQARVNLEGGACRPIILICAHAGLMTGEDGPTHADPQSLQLLQDNFPAETLVTLTPWDPRELWFLLSEALVRRPAVIAPFVTRPAVRVLDRAALGLPPPEAAIKGVCRLRSAERRSWGTVVLQGCGVTNAFLTGALPLLEREKLDVNVYAVASSELFDGLSEAEREEIFPETHQAEAMGITDFTLPTMNRWIRSDYGRAHTLHPFRAGHFLGSGSVSSVMAEARLDGESQFEMIRAYVAGR